MAKHKRGFASSAQTMGNSQFTLPKDSPSEEKNETAIKGKHITSSKGYKALMGSLKKRC
jgi:hypothetical protein